MSKNYCTTNGRDRSLHRKLLNNARKMNNNEQPAVIAVREERARIGGVEVKKKTVLAASNERLVCLTTAICCSLVVHLVIFENICNSMLQCDNVLPKAFHLNG